MKSTVPRLIKCSALVFIVQFRSDEGKNTKTKEAADKDKNAKKEYVGEGNTGRDNDANKDEDTKVKKSPDKEGDDQKETR